VGALSFIKADEKFERRSLLVGNPAKNIKDVSDEMMAWKTEGTKLYQQLPTTMMESWAACEPLRTVSEITNPISAKDYKPWKQ